MAVKLNLRELTGERLRTLREERGVSQGALAKLAGVGQATVGRYERGEVDDPGVNTLLAFAKALRIAADDVIEIAEAHATPAPPAPTPPPMGQAMVGREGVIETVLLEAFEKGRHTFADVDAVRELLRASTAQVTAATQVRGLLDAAARLRETGRTVDAGAIALELAAKLE
jgi:transcriptional regulator with XRE-family HTH domain